MLKQGKLALLISMTVVWAGCGTKVGNPSQGGSQRQIPGMIDDPVSLPAFRFDFDEFFPGLDQLLRGRDSKNDVQSTIEGLEKIVDGNEDLVQLLKTQGVMGIGQYPDVGPDGDQLVIVSGLVNAGPYHYQALLCQDGELKTQLQWSSDHMLIRLVDQDKYRVNRDLFNIRLSELKFDFALAPSIEFYHQYIDLPDDDADEDSDRGDDQRRRGARLHTALNGESSSGRLKSGLVSKVSGDESIIQSVTASYQAPELDQFIATGYIVGAVINGGQSDYLQTKLAEADCSGDFDEQAEIPSWCWVGDIMAETRDYGSAEIDEAWQRLKDYGLRSKDTLKKPEFTHYDNDCAE